MPSREETIEMIKDSRKTVRGLRQKLQLEQVYLTKLVAQLGRYSLDELIVVPECDFTSPLRGFSHVGKRARVVHVGYEERGDGRLEVVYTCRVIKKDGTYSQHNALVYETLPEGFGR